MLGKFSFFCCPLLTFYPELTFSKKSFRNIMRVSNGLNTDQNKPSVSPDFGPKQFAKAISRWQKSPLAWKVLFVWFDSLRPINNLSVIKGRVFLGWTSTKLGLMFLLKDTTQWRQWGSNPRPFGLKSSTLPLSHCAPLAWKDLNCYLCLRNTVPPIHTLVNMCGTLIIKKGHNSSNIFSEFLQNLIR